MRVNHKVDRTHTHKCRWTKLLHECKSVRLLPVRITRLGFELPKFNWDKLFVNLRTCFDQMSQSGDQFFFGIRWKPSPLLHTQCQSGYTGLEEEKERLMMQQNFVYVQLMMHSSFSLNKQTHVYLDCSLFLTQHTHTQWIALSWSFSNRSNHRNR